MIVYSDGRGWVGQIDQDEQRALLKVVGQSIGNRMHIANYVEAGDAAILIREPDNKYDSNAIGVHHLPYVSDDYDEMMRIAQDRQVGFVSKECAEVLAPVVPHVVFGRFRNLRLHPETEEVVGFDVLISW